LEFYYQHDVSQFNAQGAAGLVILSSLYDAASADPTTKQQIEATDPHVICMPNENSCLKLAVQGMHPVGEPKFVRGLSLPGATDIKTYDAGTLYATTQGMAGATEVGELHVRYKGLLYDRILDSSAATAPQNFSVSESFDAAGQVIVTATPFVPPLASILTNGLVLPNAAGVFTLPAGNYLVDYKSTIVGAGVLTTNSLSLQKNGATLANSTVSRIIGAAAVLSVDTLNGTSFISSNGTDTFNLLVTASFTVTATETALIRFVAI